MQLMDTHQPDTRLKYLGYLEDFLKSGLKDIVDVYLQSVEDLASVGDIGRAAAGRIRTYCREDLLEPLHSTFLPLDSNDDLDTASSSDVPDVGLNIRQGKRQRVSSWVNKVSVSNNAEEVEVVENAEEFEEAEIIAGDRADMIAGTDDEGDASEDDDMATGVSCEV